MIPATAAAKLLTTTRDIRQANRLQILHQLLLRKTGTRQGLSRLTGLSMATVAHLVGTLLDEGLVVEIGSEIAQMGRPTAILAINASAGACAGVDVAETYIHYELYDLALNNLARHEIQLPSSQKEPEEIGQLIAQGFDALPALAGVSREKVVGAGISIPGPFEHATGVSVFAPTWGWVNVPLQAMLAKQMAIPLYLDNPLKFNAVAEAWFGAGRTVDSMAAVVLGTGVGAGLLVNGQLLHGASNTAGEWGHTVVVAGGRTCRCGNRGCVEAYVGAPGILQTLLELDPASPLYFADDQARSIGAIAAAAEQGDATALQVTHQTARYLGAGLGSLINLLNPMVVVLGSWVAALLGPIMLPEVIEFTARQSLAKPFQAAHIVLSTMERNPVSLGAATLVLESYLAQEEKRRRQNTTERRPIVT
jgi:predicted NBD/HSP70 family sugar kinase